jgi:pimeloyl-ACP methyl ester carboxylesterase
MSQRCETKPTLEEGAGYAAEMTGDGQGLGRGSAVLVHGSWGNPGDWQWVRRLLEDRDVSVSVPDLPSCRSTSAGLTEDADTVRRAIQSSPAPVVAVGLSYGGRVISMAAAEETSVTHLIYVGDVPRPASNEDEDVSWIEEDPHIVVHDDGTYVLDNDWWLNEEAGTTFPAQVVEHLRRNPRRPQSMAATQAQTAAAWQNIRTTVLLGREDQLVPDEDRRWANDNLDDVRLLETDHFMLFRQPEVISQVVLEALEAGLAPPDA